MLKKEELAPGATGCLAKADDDEMLFILRAQDKTAPKAILNWIANNIDTLPEDKAREAFECAMKMRKQRGRKLPD